MTATYDVINPATESVVTTVDLADARATDAAIARAARPSRRGVTSRPATAPRLLRAFAAVVDAHIEELAQLEVTNSGHTISNARWEAATSATS